tara:strand:+ start:12593 stop:13273 length:681 start_codon:yes stop_codon:yes gene_type:complete
MIKKCEYCGTEFESSKRYCSRHKYCSVKCRIKAQNKRAILKKSLGNITKKCVWCSVEFKPHKFQKGQQKYCSERCRQDSKLNRISKENSFTICPQCNGIKKKKSKICIKCLNKGRIQSEEQKYKARLFKIQYLKEQYAVNGIWSPTIGRYEKPILDHLEECFNYPILRQYAVNGYFLDGYCPALNLAIEIDEKGHLIKQKQIKDKKRQSYIENELGCKFLRIPISV